MPPQRPSRKDRPGRSRSQSKQTQQKKLIHPILQDVLLCLCLVLLAIFVYRGYIIDGRVDVSPDTVSQAGPIDQFTYDFIEKYDTTPLWYPHIFGGMPFQASGSFQSLQYSFETMVTSIIPKRRFNALHGRFFFHLLLGAFSMYFLGRALSLTRSASFIAAVAYVFSTHLMATGHANRFICFMHIPLIFLATYRIFDRRHPIYAVLLGGALGSQLGSYHPQIAFYTAMMVGFYAVYTIIADLRDKHPVGSIIKSSILFAGGVTLAVAVAAVLVLPMQEYAQYSARNLSIGGSSINVPFATSWSFPPLEIFTFIIPSFAGFGGDTYWGAMPFTDFPNYLGIGVVILAVLALVLNRSRMTVFLVITLLLALLISFGRHLPPVSYFMLNFIPYFAKFRTPVMILVLLQFAVALLAGYGFHALMHRFNENRDRLVRLVKPLIGIAGASLVLTMLLTVSGSSFQGIMTDIYDQADVSHGGRGAIVSNANIRAQIDAMRFDLLINDLWIMTFFLCAGITVIVLYITRKFNTAVFIMAMSGLLIIDLLLVAARVVNPQYAPGRVESYYGNRGESNIIKALKQDDSLYRILPISELSSNEYGYFGVSSVGGYHAAKLGIYQELMDLVGFNSFAVLNMLNTKYLISNQPLAGAMLNPIIESDTGYLYQNAGVLPRAYLVDSLKIITDKQAIFDEMQSPLFNPAKYAIVEKYIDRQLGPIDSSTVQITNYTPHRIDIMVDAAAPGLLVLSEIYYPAGWEAIIDGEPAEIYKTNYVLRSIVVPAGRHDVTLEFKPASFTFGHTISRISSLVILVILIGAGACRIRKSIAKNGP